jgi:O-antigen/teichoic acid export membrane protein
MTISSFTVLLQFADLGMGNGLLNAISEANGRGDTAAAQRYVASAFFLLSGMAAVILGAFAVAYPFIPWWRVFNVVSPLAMKEASAATAALVVCIALNLPLDVVQRVQLGYQEGYASNLWRAAGSVFGLAGVLLVIYLRGGLTWLVIAISGGPVLALLLNWVSEFCWSKRWLFPNWNYYDAGAARKILGTGFLFVILQLASSLAFASDNIVAAQILGPEAVTQYAVPARMFGVLGMVAGLLFIPLWPAYGEALARDDIKWIRRTLIRSLQLVLLLVGLPDRSREGYPPHVGGSTDTTLIPPPRRPGLFCGSDNSWKRSFHVPQWY